MILYMSYKYINNITYNICLLHISLHHEKKLREHVFYGLQQNSFVV